MGGVEHGSFDYKQEYETVDEKLQETIGSLNYIGTEYASDNSAGRLSCFYFDPEK